MATTLRSFRKDRGLALDALGVIAGRDTSTISRIENGKQQASADTIVRLAMGLGVSARRMKAMCDASWAEGHLATAAN